MSTYEKTEKVDVEYTGSKIIIRGKTFEVSAQIGATDLAAIYMSGKGNAEATISVDVPDTTQQTKKEGVTEATPPKRRKKIKTLAEVKAEEVPHRYDVED